jgi:sugar (pentulose or hexulose) kinase
LATGVAIGIDCGTSGLRAALIDASGRPCAVASGPILAAERMQPEAWWRALCAAIARLGTASRLDQVGAIAVAGTSGTLVAVDREGTPCGPASMYNAPALARTVAMIDYAAPPESAARGIGSALARAVGLQRRPGTVRVLHEADWLAGRLRGVFDTTDENNALPTGYDPVARAWPPWISLVGLEPRVLPEVVPPGTALGPIHARAAAALGLPRGSQVVAGTTDGCAAFLASGAGSIGDAVTAFGPTLALAILCDRPVFEPAFGICSHRLGERWLAGGASNTGAAVLLAHFSAARIETLSARIDPGRPSGLHYYPLPAPGERFPVNDPELPPRLAPRPRDDAEFLHGLLEGIARIEALGYARLTECGAPSPAAVRTVGPLARNRTATAIRGRLLGVEMLAAESEEAAVGAARLALAALAGQRTPAGQSTTRMV